MIFSARAISVALALLTVLQTPTSASAESNIDPNAVGRKYGWMENGGWLNLQGDFENGVNVGASVLQGYAWHENFGWINFGDGTPDSQQYSNTTAEDFGVNIDANGKLSGYAWGENIGWISMDTTTVGGSQVVISQPTGQFTGYAWSENVGWLAFDTVEPAHVATASGYTMATDWVLFD